MDHCITLLWPRWIQVSLLRGDNPTSVQIRVRPIPVSGIGYRPILASIGGHRYQPILIRVSVPIPVVLSFVYLSQRSTLLQRTPIVSSLYRIFGIFRAYTPHTYITCTHLYPAQNRIFSIKNLYSPVSVSV